MFFLGLFEDWHEVALSRFVIFHFTGVDVQISQYSNYEFICGFKMSDRSEGTAVGRGGECGGMADEDNGCYQSHVDDIICNGSLRIMRAAGVVPS
eukprot:scaffold46389_cov110-Skeletonema_marinoi.AAC.1